ncbi:heat shock factor protein isoform X3 [Scaptodrosophila lebanonensis]|uniref:Heat shock factor protein isoform X3 n=1 Tax=Drosophila lebanonensis TaxID=7225 RepID=A0A6J2UIX0_DROLE|nr:heat shock factor protein isoform X3 [Scaptodrosophila lebanonensis]
MSSKVPRLTVKAVQLKHEASDEEDEDRREEPRRRNMPTLGESSSGSSSGVPAFLAKLWRLVDDPDTNNLICWSKDGRSFIIQNQAQFARELLPLNYKHNNMASFIRQLNMYGFHKITSIDNGGLRFDRDEIEFSHPYFKRNYPYLLDQIKRKISNTKNVEDKNAVMKQETVSKVLSDVKVMRGRQDNLDSRFSVMKQENEALWREIASLRQKHAKQQQIVNKLIQFLISIVQPSRNMSGVKRHMQLMINDTPDNARSRTISETESEGGGGPVIHELSEELLDEVMNPHSPSQYDNESVSPLAMERPRSNVSIGSINYDYSNQSGEDLLNMASGGNSGAVATVGNMLTGAKSPLASNSNRSPSQQVLYTVTEAPDSHATELPNSPYGSEELNELTTPMVREQEERKRQQLKEKNKQRRRAADQADATTKSIRTRAQSKASDPQLTQVKLESDVSNLFASDSKYNNETKQQSQNVNEMVNMPSLIEPNNANLYDVNFISNDMPTDIFEDVPLLSDGSVDAAYKLNEQQQFGRSTVNSGRFSNTPLGFDITPTSVSSADDGSPLLNDANLPSTSKAAAAAKGNGTSTEQQDMTVAKYTGGDNGIAAPLRLSSVDEVSGHIENIQDELDTLKDMLRGEGVSIDQNMLMGAVQNAADRSASSKMPVIQLTEDELLLKLFNDAELLDNYGLTFPSDNMSNNDKKSSGSELMTYQPSMYDLSDILDTSDESNKNQSVNDSSSRQLQTQSSVLNTPRHEM